MGYRQIKHLLAMPVLDHELYSQVIQKGKQAVEMLQAQDLDGFFKFAEEGWHKFPDPKESWNQGCSYAKMVFKEALSHQEMDQAKTWLTRMVENNNRLKLFDFECEYYQGKYYFETGEYNAAFDKFDYVVKGAEYRYFDENDSKYLDFFNRELLARGN